MDESLTVGIAIASIEELRMRPVVADNKDLAHEDVTWDNVA